MSSQYKNIHKISLSQSAEKYIEIANDFDFIQEIRGYYWEKEYYFNKNITTKEVAQKVLKEYALKYVLFYITD